MASTPHAHEEKHGGHITLPMLVATLVVLLILTWVTVSATWFDFGRSINLWIAMIIATIKAILVCLYFMHLRYEKPIVHIILTGTFFFVALFIGAAMFDTSHYDEYVREYRASVEPWMPQDPNEIEKRWAPEYFQIKQQREAEKARQTDEPKPH
jgi:cytochrome c oxidase subunit 4